MQSSGRERRPALAPRDTEEPPSHERSERWWSGHTLVNGVFEGGGAKGVAYVGALQKRPARELGYGVAATFVSSSGTPPWIAAHDNVVALPIESLDPRNPVRALSFDMSPEQRNRLIEKARQATHDFLDGRTPGSSGQPVSGPADDPTTEAARGSA